MQMCRRTLLEPNARGVHKTNKTDLLMTQCVDEICVWAQLKDLVAPEDTCVQRV